MLKNDGICIGAYLQLFPLLKQPQGFIFLLNDFEKLYPANCDLLYLNWSPFRNAVQEILNDEKIPSKFNDIGGKSI